MKDEAQGFLDRARYPKGKRTLQAIYDATYQLVITEGLSAASQEAIAKRAKVTQSALRHYFPTKDELLRAFFLTGVQRLKDLLGEKMAEYASDPRAQLLESAAMHFDRIIDEQDVYFYEAAGYWSRSPEFRSIRDEWYGELHSYYARLVGSLHPDWSEPRRLAAGYQILTMVLGGWITLGSSRPLLKEQGGEELKAMLLDGIAKLI
jgi:AcrR family transcriptional regulator